MRRLAAPGLALGLIVAFLFGTWAQAEGPITGVRVVPIKQFNELEARVTASEAQVSDLANRVDALEAEPAPEPTEDPEPTPNPTPTPTPTPEPSPGFPDASNTGVPAGTTLTDYSGPLRITTPNTVIDGKRINGNLSIQTSGVVIKNSLINGTVSTDENSTGYSFSIIDSEVDAGDRYGTGVGAVNFTMLRVEVRGGNRSVNCWKNCDVRDSWLHAQMHDESGAAHESGLRMGNGGKVVHNTIVCDAPNFPPDAGCSASLTGYGDFAPVANMLIQDNFFPITTGGTCAYGGNSKGKPYYGKTSNIRFIGNLFERDPQSESGKSCGWWFTITDFDRNAPGNEWTNNRYTDGTVVPADGY